MKKDIDFSIRSKVIPGFIIVALISVTMSGIGLYIFKTTNTTMVTFIVILISILFSVIVGLIITKAILGLAERV